MEGKLSTPGSVLTPNEFISRFKSTLNAVDPTLLGLIDFKLEIQKKNLMSLVQEAQDRLQRYDQIYPYIKEICRNQTINPAWYVEIEKVLNWALKKGRGKGNVLSKDLKIAWICYIVLLSCAMIDKEESGLNSGRHLLLKASKGNLIGFTGNN